MEAQAERDKCKSDESTRETGEDMTKKGRSRRRRKRKCVWGAHKGLMYLVFG